MPILYHGTCLLALEGIEQEGKLIPNQLQSSDALHEGYKKEDFEGYLFLTDSISHAIHYSTLATANNIRSSYHQVDWMDLTVVLEIELPEEQLLPDYHDAPHAKDWKESLSLCQSVRYKGEMTAKQIKNILFCHYELDAPVLKCSLGNWKEALMQYGHLFKPDQQEKVTDDIRKGQIPIVIK